MSGKVAHIWKANLHLFLWGTICMQGLGRSGPKKTVLHSIGHQTGLSTLNILLSSAMHREQKSCRYWRENFADIKEKSFPCSHRKEVIHKNLLMQEYKGKKSLDYSTPFYFLGPTLIQYTFLTLYWEVQSNIKVREPDVRVSYLYSHLLPPQQTPNIIQVCAAKKGWMEKHSHFASFLIIWPFGYVKKKRILWVSKQALPIWTCSMILVQL